jgi:hypothetical protein
MWIYLSGEQQMKKLIVLALVPLLVFSGVAQAESSAAKKELVTKLLQLQQPGIEMAARTLAERPAAQMVQQAGLALQARVTLDKREAVAKDMQADLKKYLDEAVPLVTERALKLAPSTVGALIEEKFSEQELKELIAIIESPVNRKFVALGGDMQKALVEKLVAETQDVINPKVKLLEQSLSKRLGITPAKSPAIK